VNEAPAPGGGRAAQAKEPLGGASAGAQAAGESPHKGKKGLARVIAATRHSLTGLGEAFRVEQAFRIEVTLVALFMPLGLLLGRDGVERALLAGSVFAVLVVELLNSAIEAAVDRVSLDEHRFARRAKDFGSAAVMLALALAGFVWLLVLFG